MAVLPFSNFSCLLLFFLYQKKKRSLHKIALVRSKGHFSTKATIIMCIADIYNTNSNITATEALAMAHCLRPESQLSTTYIQVCIRYSPALCTA